MKLIPPIPNYYTVGEYPRLYVTITYPPANAPTTRPPGYLGEPWLCFVSTPGADPPPEELNRLYKAARYDSDAEAQKLLRIEYARRGLNYTGVWEDSLILENQANQHPYFKTMYQDLGNLLWEHNPQSTWELAKLLVRHRGAKELHHVVRGDLGGIRARLGKEDQKWVDNWVSVDHVGLLIHSNPRSENKPEVENAFEEIKTIARHHRLMAKTRNFLESYSSVPESYLVLDFPIRKHGEQFFKQYSEMKEWQKKMKDNTRRHRVLTRAIRDISSMTHFYSQETDYCVAALQEAAKDLNLPLSEEEASELIPQLQKALEAISQPQEKHR